MNNRFVWYDLMSTDVEATKSFYQAFVGWTTTDTPMGDMTYTMLAVDGESLGGIVPFDPNYGFPSHFMPYIGVSDINATCGAIGEHGGKVCVPPTQLGQAGTMAVVEDPSGGTFSLWESADPGEDAKASKLFSVGWNQLMSSDPQGVIPFYEQVFGWTVKYVGDDCDDFALFELDGVDVASLMDRPPETQRDYWLSYILVPDVAKWQLKAEQLGAKTLVPKHVIKGQGEFSVHADPTGAVFALWASEVG